jgi:phosphopentomutase
MKRFFLIVLDGCGAGELPDAREYGPGDLGSNTLGNTSGPCSGGLRMPHLAARAGGHRPDGRRPCPAEAPAFWGRLRESSKGKDTVTGHWEMMGIHTAVRSRPIPTDSPTK